MLQQADGSRQTSTAALEANALRFPGRIWFLALLISVFAIAAVFPHVDVSIVRRFNGVFGPAKSLAEGLASRVLLSIEAAVALALVIARITRGHLSPFRQATALACLTSICAYAINDGILKHLFGVPNPDAVLHGARHLFHLLDGSSNSSFPSGHMVLAGAFAGVFMRLYRRSIRPLSALLLLAAVLLILGDWHFVSDIIAGTFVGVSAGLLAGEVWLVHSK